MAGSNPGSFLHAKMQNPYLANSSWYKEDLSTDGGPQKDLRIHLFLLEPGGFETPITGRLQRVELSHALRFDALSYCWGDQIEYAHISIDQQDGFSVTRNLERALRRMRSGGAVRPLWIDAICVNQLNVAERTVQVQLMRQIYSQARTVLVWLGDCEEQNPLSKIEKLSDQRLGRYIRERPEFHDNTSTNVWWKRVWVIQEVAFAKSLMVYYGPYILPWSEFTGAHNSTKDQLDRFRMIRRPYASSRSALSELMIFTCECIASDTRDKIFALVGLAGDESRLVDFSLRPDYSLSKDTVFERASRYLATRQPTEVCLACWKPLAFRMTGKMPEWTWDFTSDQPSEQDRRLVFTIDRTFRDCENVENILARVESPLGAVTRAWRCDASWLTLPAVGNGFPGSDTLDDMLKTVRANRSVAEKDSEAPHHELDFLDMFMTLNWHYDANYNAQRDQRPYEPFWHLRTPLATMNLDFVDQRMFSFALNLASKLGIGTSFENLDNYLRRWSRRADNRSAVPRWIFVTDQGYIGAADEVQESALLKFFPGSQFPFALHSFGETYELVNLPRVSGAVLFGDYVLNETEDEARLRAIGLS